MTRRTALGAFAAASLRGAGEPPIRTLRVTILSTMLADRGIGEWGFGALVEANGRKILFDTGARPQTVLNNAREMNVELSDVTDVILSHNHGDHTGGFLTLREVFGKKNRNALSRAWVAEGIFLASRKGTPMPAAKAVFEDGGGSFEFLKGPREIFPGAWLTGPVPRKHPEKNWSGNVRSADTIPEDQSLVLDTVKGLVVVAGCGHAGIINTLEHARETVRNAPVHAAIGGFHLFNASDETLAWTADHLKRMGLAHFLGAHCTGIEAVYKIRGAVGLSRRTCAVGSVGGVFDLEKGLLPGALAG
jgi:7,8-dihydropterin-6-yl-methyl-4-(beta-D-ribofuranosyl)aminobenzene 5'-phosphate synthase